MDNLRVGTRDPILLLTRAADKLVALKPGDAIRAQVAEVLPGGEVNLRIQGNLFRAKSSLQLPENASVLLRVVGRNTAEGASEVRLQFLEVIPQAEAGQMPQSPAPDPLQMLTRELASKLASKTQVSTGLAATVEGLLKTLPEDVSRIPAETREQLLTLLQTSLKTTGQSIQDRLNQLLNQFKDRDYAPMQELATLKGKIFADIETVSQLPLKSTLTNTGVGLEARLRVLAEAVVEAGEPPLQNSLPAPSTDQAVGTSRLPLELKDALVQLNQQGVPLPPDLKAALQHVDSQNAPLPPQLQTDPLHSDFKARLLQIREMVLDQQAQMLKLDLSERLANAASLREKKAALDQMLQSVDGLLQDVETFQLLSKLTDSFYTFLPFIWKGLKEADIAFKQSGSGTHGRSYYCLVHLDLEELGKLEVVAMMAGSEFFVTFKTDHEQFRSVLSAHMNELQEMFAAKGLKLGLVSVYEMQEKQLVPLERLESFESLINIRI